MKRSLFVIALISLALPVNSFARDSENKTCNGVGSISSDGSKKSQQVQIALKYREARAGGDKRGTWIEMSVNGRHYSGNTLNDSADKFSIKLVNDKNPGDAFVGNVKVIRGEGSFALKLHGKFGSGTLTAVLPGSDTIFQD